MNAGNYWASFVMDDGSCAKNIGGEVNMRVLFEAFVKIDNVIYAAHGHFDGEGWVVQNSYRKEGT